MGNAGRSGSVTAESLGPRAQELEATVDGRQVSELFCLFRGQTPFLITPSGTHEFAKMFFWRPDGPDGHPRFAMGALDGYNRIGPEDVKRADLELGKGLTITTRKYKIFVAIENLQCSWRE